MSNKTPKAEWPILSSLLENKQNEYVEYPRNDEQFLFLQKCYLVVFYQTKDTCTSIMSDNIRNTTKDALSASVRECPALEEMQGIMDRFTELTKQMMALLEKNNHNKNLTVCS